MDTDFDRWNKQKQELNSLVNTSRVFVQPRDVWMISLGKNVGFEQDGSGNNFARPVLIVKKFNNQMFWAIPLSTVQKKLDFYFNFVDPQHRQVSAILAQLRLISIKRCKRFLYRIDKKDYANIINQLSNLLSI